ncbi:MAG: pyruvate:ferredoxin (flavodoxin) oxidoreductase [Clostridiales bacterium]
MAKVMKTMDGNTAAAHVSYAFTDVAAIYPITPSSNMAEAVDLWSSEGRKNIFGQEVKVAEMQSEAGAAGAVHGSLAAGALTTTFTASQGLLLMIPNMYKISGELLPGVFHVSARAVAAHALSIFGEHSDVMACRQTGFSELASCNVQEVMDLGAVAHLAAIKTRVPFLHFFDGFRTSHEIQKIEILDYNDLSKIVDHEAIKEFRNRALNPEHPVTRGTAQNPDIFFQARESSNKFYDKVPDIVDSYMKEIKKLTGREYNLFDYYGDPEAKNIIIAMGSICDTIEETIDHLNSKGEKVGLLKVRLYRPFSVKHFLNAVPKTVAKIAVLERTKEPGSLGEPLYEDIRTAYYEESSRPTVVGGRYGLGSKDTTPAQIISVYENLKSDTPKNHFTIGITDDVTFTSLDLGTEPDIVPAGTVSCKFWGLGSDGTVGANKNSIKIIGDNTDKFVQGYFSYDSKKSGGVTISHLRFGDKPIKSSYFIKQANFVACHNPSYIDKYDIVCDLKKNGIFLFNSNWDEKEFEKNLPNDIKACIANNNIKVYNIDAFDIAEKIGLGGRINLIMQSAFFKLTNIIPISTAVKYMKDAAFKSYGHKGDNIVKMNYEAIDRGIESLKEIQIPESWKNAKLEVKEDNRNIPDFIKNVVEPINRLEGDLLPVSAFEGREDGTFDIGTSAYEKRSIAVNVPEWIPENCIQCNQCSYVCPHAVIRPYILNEEESKNSPAEFKTIKAMGREFPDMKFRIQISVMDCTGCGNCAQVCPSKNKALEMKPIASQMSQTSLWDHAQTIPNKADITNTKTIKGSQFKQPLVEFSGACAGCGETPYAKLVTQLFGDRMMIANATGCSSIWGASAPATPYTVDKNGHGPAWANSLFEDNAEYGYGMNLAVNQIRSKIKTIVEEVLNYETPESVKLSLTDWLENIDNGDKTRTVSEKLISELAKYKATDEKISKLVEEILENKDFLVKRSQWIFGGDGWAYDIGFGGLDHVIASGEDVNILVFDTEVYSNTGGQSSKATPTGAIAQFAAAGKGTMKKDLGLIAMSYGNVYVAQVGMGANQNQFIKALIEAESYPGPSIIIAYAPCINHGLKLGMGCTQLETKMAVESGYWHLYRYNPVLKDSGKNPFILDSKPPKSSFKEFLLNEVRYSALAKSNPERADLLFSKAEEESKERLKTYENMAK